MRVNTQRLSETFVELADSLVMDFDVIDFLHLLATRCTQVLDVNAAGVLLADATGNLRVMGASSEAVRLLELFQVQNDQGPCLDAFRTGRAVNVTERATIESRWPRFAARTPSHGFGAVQALPMRLREDVVGALNLFSDPPGLDEAETRIAQAMADVATIGILQHRAHRQADTVVTQLQTALNSRVVIEQAKGVLAERLDVDMARAFHLLRQHARSNNRHLSDTAQAVVAGTEDLSGLGADPGTETPA